MRIKITQIKIGSRFRKDYGNVQGLADSIKEIGQLHPIGVDSNYRLIFGERRIKACELLGMEFIEGNIIHLPSLLKGEFAENEFSKGWAVSERVAILEAIECHGHGGDRKQDQEPNSALDLDTAAKQAGLGGKTTARLAKKVVESGTPELVDAMDDGQVSVSAAADVSELPEDEQQEVVAKGEKEILKAAKEIRANRKNHRAQGTGENEWYTPEKYIESACEVLGGIDLDPASSDAAQKAVNALRFFNKETNGLEQDWAGCVWLNPPYSQPDIQLFMEKAVAEYSAGHMKSAIILTHNYTDTKWFHLISSISKMICFTRGRIAFVGPGGEKAAPTQGQAFFYIGDDAELFERVFSEHGLILNNQRGADEL